MSETIRLLEEVLAQFERLEERNLCDQEERDLIRRLDDHLFKLREQSKRPEVRTP